MYVMNIQLSDWRTMFDDNNFYEYIMELLNSYEALGPLPGFLLPFIEAFLPFLPLFVFVIANAAAYGLLEGFLLSWAGASTGAFRSEERRVGKECRCGWG